MTIRSFSSFNQARSIADEYARATNRTIYVIYEAPEFHLATEEDLGTFFVGLSDHQIRYSTAERAR
jgi:hypothetical protein